MLKAGETTTVTAVMKASKKSLARRLYCNHGSQNSRSECYRTIQDCSKNTYALGVGRNISYRCSCGRCLLSIPKIWKEVIMGEQVIVLTDLTKKIR